MQKAPSEREAFDSPALAEQSEKEKALELATFSDGLPTLPGYVFELNRLLSARVVDLKQVSEVIRTDPSLSAQVMRLCHAGPVKPGVDEYSLDEAILFLGRDRLRTLVLTCSVLEYAGRRLSPSFVQSFWQHGFLAALLSERIARWTVYPNPEKAYLAGLLHDIGALPVLDLLCRQQSSAQTFPLEELEDSIDAERKHFGVDHCEIGRRIGIAWNFPPAFIEVFECHHRPAEAVHDPHLVGIVTTADQCCQWHGVVLGAVPRQLKSVDRRLYELLRTCLPRLSEEKEARLAEYLETECLRLIPLLEFGGSGMVAGGLFKHPEGGERS